MDPRPNVSISSYACFANNPIIFTDFKGDTLSGVNEQSAKRTLDLIHSSFSGDKMKGLRNLFQLNEDGVTFKMIAENEFKSSIKGLTEDEQSLAYGYFQTINDINIHIVEVISPDENSTHLAQIAFGDDLVNGEKFEEVYGGGANRTFFSENFNISYNVIVLNYKSLCNDCIFGCDYFIEQDLPEETLAHELLGHGLGHINAGKYDKSSTHIEAIQADNLALRVTGKGYVWRNGTNHGENTQLDKETANKIPYYLQLPQKLK